MKIRRRAIASHQEVQKVAQLLGDTRLVQVQTRLTMKIPSYDDDRVRCAQRGCREGAKVSLAIDQQRRPASTGRRDSNSDPVGTAKENLPP